MAPPKHLPGFGRGKNEQRDAKVTELTQRVEMLENLAETQAKVIFSMRQELTELRELHVAEMNLRVVYIMRQFQFKRKASNISDASGVVPTVIESLMDRYRNGGREALLTQLEAENEAIAKQEADEAARAQSGEPGGPPTPAREAEDGATLEPTDEDVERIRNGRTN